MPANFVPGEPAGVASADAAGDGSADAAGDDGDGLADGYRPSGRESG